MHEIDWTTELRKIEREYSGLPAEPSAEQVRAKRAAEKRAIERKNERTNLIYAVVKLNVVTALAAALTFWPYERSCGLGLSAYMTAQSVIIAGGVWTGIATWRGRFPRLHLLALLLTLWGITVVGAQVLPRIGYARPNPGPPARWSCSADAGPVAKP